MNEVNEETVTDYLKYAKNCLSADKSTDTCIETLETLKNHVRLLKNVNSNLSIEYSNFLNFLMNCLSTKWYRSCSDSQTSQLFDHFFLQSYREESYLVLMRTVSETCPSHKLDKSLQLLNDFFATSLRQMFLDQAFTPSDHRHRNLRSEISNDIVTYLVSLPDRISNKQMTKICTSFKSESYFLKIVEAMLWSLEKMVVQIESSVDTSLNFHSRLLGRCCIAGYSGIVLPPLISAMVSKTADNFIWRRVTSKLFDGIPDNYQEVVITFLLRKTQGYKSVSRLLGNIILSNKKLKYIMTHKLLLIRSFDDVILLHNLLGYLADDDSRRKLLIEVLLNLVDVWGNKSSLKHRPYHQHLYLSKSIVISLAHLTDDDKKHLKNDLLTKLMHATNSHLISPLPEIRNIGMTTAKILSRTVDPNGPQLNFEVDTSMAEVAELESLLKLSEEPTAENKAADLDESQKEHSRKNSGVTFSDINDESTSKMSSKLQESDDDLEPYDMSADKVHRKKKKPYYLKDCITGLTEANDPEYQEICLQCVESLVRNDSLGLDDVAIELAKILLHLEDNYSAEEFGRLKHGALVSLLVKCPKQVSEYLCTEFYDRNYSLAQRMDILDVLVAASQELSKPETAEGSKKLVEKPIKRSAGPSEEANWKEIVQQRIDNKSKRFAKGRVQPNLPEVPNRFAPFAGCFFFPLILHYDRRQNTFDLLGSDFYLLGRLVHSLGMIQYAAINTPIAYQMGRTLMEFIWTLKYHSEPYVRRALVFALIMVVLSVSAHLLITSLSELMDFCQWLQDIVSKDADIECGQLATRALMLIESVIKENFKSDLL